MWRKTYVIWHANKMVMLVYYCQLQETGSPQKLIHYLWTTTKLLFQCISMYCICTCVYIHIVLQREVQMIEPICGRRVLIKFCQKSSNLFLAAALPTIINLTSPQWQLSLTASHQSNICPRNIYKGPQSFWSSKT